MCSADVVARLGGDEFAVVAVQTDLAAAHIERDRLGDMLAAASVPASVVAAARTSHGLVPAVVSADDDDV